MINLTLNKNLNRQIQRGHPWIYKEALKSTPKANVGEKAKLTDKSGKFLAYGYYDPNCELCFRVCSLNEKQKPNDFWALNNMRRALEIRQCHTNSGSYRLFNGEGDFLPGLVCDIYDKAAVIQLDGHGPMGFWNLDFILKFLKENLSLEHVVFKPRADLKLKPQVLMGSSKQLENFAFYENGLKFSANLIEGQKTGFFLDQRNNRALVKKYSKDKKVLNLFSYTGGFSVYAGVGGASHVTSIDISKPATEQAKKNWDLNFLKIENHSAVAINVFDFLENAKKENLKWDLVIVDPPSFSHTKNKFKEALEAYVHVFKNAIEVCEKEALIAFSSCSSHIDEKVFLELCTEAFSKSKKRAQVISISGQAEDHPYPLVCTELRYLNFVLFRLF